MSCWALIGIKSLSQGKERLAGVLTSTQRQQLIQTMLGNVLRTLGETRSIQHVAVVSPDPLPLPSGIVLMRDPGGGLNAALAYGMETLDAAGASELLVLHGDLPFLDPTEIDTLLDLGRHSRLALAPDRHRRGTNAIYMATGIGFQLQFGPDSLRKHQAEAIRHGLTPAIVDLPGFAFDIDEPCDLNRLSELRHTLHDFLTPHGTPHHDPQFSGPHRI